MTLYLAWLSFRLLIYRIILNLKKFSVIFIIDSFMSLCVAIVHLFSLLHGIPLYECDAMYSFGDEHLSYFLFKYASVKNLV